MGRQVETTISEAATRNLSVTATLEWLADMELEARNHRAIERRPGDHRVYMPKASALKSDQSNR
jgi:hypothetical protein